MAAYPPVPSESEVFTALTSFLRSVLSDDVEVVQANQNLVPEPRNPDYVEMNPILRGRLETNTDVSTDVFYVGSIAGNVLTVTTVHYGTVAVGQPVVGPGVAAGQAITALGTGTGGAGTYAVGQAQTVASGSLSSGSTSIRQNVEMRVQLDVHGPNSGNNAQTISTLFRDQFAVSAFAALIDNVAPCYADDPRQVVWVNAEQQYETKWSVDAVLQVNETIYFVPQQFADQLAVTTIDVQTTYP